MLPTKISDGKLLGSNFQEPENHAIELVMSKINEIDTTRVLRWLTVDLDRHAQMEDLKRGLDCSPWMVAAWSLKDRVQKLNSVLADLRVKLVTPFLL